MKFIIILYIIYIIINNLHNQSGVQFVQGVHNNLNNLTNTNESILFYSIEKLKKDELVQTVKELQSKVKDDKKLTFIDIIKLFYKKVYQNYSFIVKFLSKITILSIIFKLISKIKWIRVIWITLYSMVTFILGLAYSDVYGFKDIIESINNYWSYIINYIHDTKYFQFIIKILNFIKQESVISENKNENIKIEDNLENKKDISEIKENGFSSWKSETEQSSNIENDRWNNWNSEKNKIEETDKPFYLNWYFLISVSIISASLIYYYWDNISELSSNLIEKLKNLKPGDDPNNNPRDVDNTPRPKDIELRDSTSNFNIHEKVQNMDLESITNFHDKINIETNNLLNNINNRIKFYSDHPNLNSSQRLKMNLDFRRLFDQLKLNQVNQIEIFNKLSTLNLEDGADVLKNEDRLKLIKNINSTMNTLNKHSEVIPNYNLELDNLPKLNVELDRPLSPLQDSTKIVENLNTTVEKSWGASSSNLSPSSDGSDDTIKANK